MVLVELLQINANRLVVALMIKLEMFHGAFTKMKFCQKKNQLQKLSIGQKINFAQRCQKLERQELTMSALMVFGKLKIRSFSHRKTAEKWSRTPVSKMPDILYVGIILWGRNFLICVLKFLDFRHLMVIFSKPDKLRLG